MREFKRRVGITAAIITGFRGSNIVLTDDGDVLVVGGPWIAQRTPSVGDLIYREPGNVYGIIARRLIDERFGAPEPIPVDLDGDGDPDIEITVLDEPKPKRKKK